MKIIIAGNNKRCIELLHYLKKKNINIITAIAHPQKKSDKKGFFINISNSCKRLKINCLVPRNINSNNNINKLKLLKPDLIVLCGYSASILSKKIFSIPTFGSINAHASLLPKYRGGSPLNWALINGEKHVGISIIQVDEGIDTGDIIIQHKINISNKINIRNLTNKINKIYPKILYKIIQNFKKNKIKKTKQNHSISTYYKKRSFNDGEIFFLKMSAYQVFNLVRALTTPYPNSYFVYNHKIIKVIDSKVIKNNNIPGKIIKINKNSLIIGCKKNSIKLILNNDCLSILKILKVNQYVK